MNPKINVADGQCKRLCGAVSSGIFVLHLDWSLKTCTSAGIEMSDGIRYIARGGMSMPIFEYKCQDCGARFERIVSSASASVHCGKCESPNVNKLPSVFAVAKGSHSAASFDDGPCRTCGARERGMCGE